MSRRFTQRWLLNFVVPSVLVSNAPAQGTFQYDQQSATNYFPPTFSFSIQGYGPVGQSFTPALPSVGFIQLEPGDALPVNGIGGTMYLNLRSNSISGAILGSTAPVFLPDS